MKKYIYLILVMIVFRVQAQEAITFKLKYLPSHKYDMIYKLKMDGDINISGNEQMITQMKSQGMTMPLKIVMDMVMNAKINTEKPTTNKSFPLQIEVSLGDVNINLSGKQIPVPKAASTQSTIYGHVDEDGKLFTDSLTALGKKDTSQKKLSKAISAFQNSIKFPETPMHIGDSFTQEMPFSFPIGNGANTTLKTVYKLVSIADGKALFDVNQVMDVRINIQNADINLSGIGNGKMTFDIKNSYPTVFTDQIKLKFDGQFNTTTVNGLLGMSMDINYVIN